MGNLISYLVENQFQATLVALPIVVVINIMLGAALANFKNEFDWGYMFLGLKKGIVVYIAIGTLSFVAQFVKFADIELVSSMALIVYGVMATYVIQDVQKISDILGYKKSEIE